MGQTLLYTAAFVSRDDNSCSDDGSKDIRRHTGFSRYLMCEFRTMMTEPETPVTADVTEVTSSACSPVATSMPAAPAIEDRTQTIALIRVGLMIEVLFKALSFEWEKHSFEDQTGREMERRKGKALPPFKAAAALAKAGGMNLDWPATGEDLAVKGYPPDAVDPDLLKDVIELADSELRREKSAPKSSD